MLLRIHPKGEKKNTIYSVTAKKNAGNEQGVRKQLEFRYHTVTNRKARRDPRTHRQEIPRSASVLPLTGIGDLPKVEEQAPAHDLAAFGMRAHISAYHFTLTHVTQSWFKALDQRRHPQMSNSPSVKQMSRKMFLLEAPLAAIKSRGS